ncbi:hypothetical protein PGIGA_G00013030 [Pangasianodon gigas]|uniref:Uncharacterized protein n=1 Tax=Pangasianodon gigas TaxID=30993 RepID=A0ACC5WT84_PANGG|nr:hypothetical protein [Pangasianodon gigas]
MSCYYRNDKEKPYLYTHRNSPVQPESETYSAEEQIEPLSTSFPCTVISPSPSVPTSVHLLRPADIKVVAALGDSLTAGYGAGSGQNDLLGVLTEYRGLSWSIGGNGDLSTVTTLANILRKFNPSLTGFSTGTGKATTTQAFLNQAVGGAKSKDLPSQAQALISRMKSDSRINFQNHWKVITVFIGGNDLCEYCTNLNLYSADNFAKNIRDTLDILHQEVPRALVNLVEIFNIAPLRQLHQDSKLGCPTWVVKNVCPCVVNPAEGSSELKALTDMNTAYQTATRNLVASGRYNTRSDFNVVLQPFFRKVYFPVLSAGFGAKAKNILQLLNEERGVSWNIGGDETLETVTTLPNILKKFNPNVFGFSQGCSKRPNGFNMAVSGAKAIDIPGQVRDLVDALKSSTSVDFERDWKLVTLFIGGNDLCQYCKNQTSLSPKKYIGYIKDALDILYHEVPRVLVNFVEILQIEDLRKIKSNTIGCTLLQPNLCPCFLRPEENSAELVEMKRINRQIQTETERLVFRGKYEGREDFAVVLQPFFQSTVVPVGEDRKPDLSFFSVDCFHFSERGHAEMAIALWNNMLEPVGSKQSYNNFTHDRSKLRCPSEDHPFIFTQVNSFNSEPIEPVPTSPLVSPQGSVAFWVTALLTIAGVLVGGVLAWLTLSCGKWSKKKSSDNLSSVQIQGCESKL